MRELALHLLDIAENSVAAGAKQIEIGVRENFGQDRLELWVEDDGIGMDAAAAARAVDPFVTSRTTRKVGLGLPLLKAAAQACQGDLTIRSAPGEGTRVDVTFQHSHLDRMPLGDLAATLLTLVVAYPAVRWLFRYDLDGRGYEFDSAPITAALGEVPLSEPGVLAYLRETITAGIEGIQALPDGQTV